MIKLTLPGNPRHRTLRTAAGRELRLACAPVLAGADPGLRVALQF